ncbi:hypothetical protein [Ramlibacter humi]|uniref:Thioredoxin-like fold domain-containing protein n=1 Tax=Ramlibacter humi TaxID=2530451 RepID=A0A4Z0BJA5_9BURK|nr:hypothetical protein [Ramlibacter humi]TFY98204.1 hypothetical protein EZ216_16520 [Ramlibacter humi]
MRRRELLLAAPALALPAFAQAATLPTPTSLADELQQALGKGRPLVVMASLEGCPFCRVVRDSHLAPLRAQTGQPIVQVDMGSRAAVADFQGKASTHEQLLREWRIKLAPVVMFFGRGGREVAERLVGASIPDFYGAYLEQRLQAAMKSIAPS